MPTCTVCLKGFEPGTYQMMGHQACVDSALIPSLRGVNTELKRKLAATEEELRRVDKMKFPNTRVL